MHSSVKNEEETRMRPNALESSRLDIVPKGRNSIDLGEERRDSFQNLRSQCFLQNCVMSGMLIFLDMFSM